MFSSEQQLPNNLFIILLVFGRSISLFNYDIFADDFAAIRSVRVFIKNSKRLLLGLEFGCKLIRIKMN